MKIIHYLFFLLSLAVGEALDCSYGQEKALPDSQGPVTLRQVVNTVDATVTIQLVYEGKAWLGIGATDSFGGMVGGEVVIGLPDDAPSSTNPGKYSLSSRDTAGVTLMPSQTLRDASIQQNDTHTVLEFTKLLAEENEREIRATGSNTFIYAVGSTNALGYHAIRDSFSLELTPCSEDDTPAPTASPTKKTESPTPSPTKMPIKETTPPTASPSASPSKAPTPPDTDDSTPPIASPSASPTKAPTPPDTDDSFITCKNAIDAADSNRNEILESSEFPDFIYEMGGDEAFQGKTFEQLPVDLQILFYSWSSPGGIDVSTPNDTHVTHLKLFCQDAAAVIQEQADSPVTHVLINAGGPAITASGITWEADAPYATGGRTYTVGNEQNISGTEDLDILYRSERNGNTTYNIALEDGAYQVRLHFAETHPNITGRGQRMFDVEVQGVLLYEDLDVFDRAGGLYAALVLETETSVSDGNLKIGFLPGGSQKPMVSGIEVHSLFV